MDYFLSGTVIDKLVGVGGQPELSEIGIGHGRILLCPLPIELSGSLDAIRQIYSVAMEKAEVKNKFLLIENPIDCRQVAILPAHYERCTVLTMVNEGSAVSLTLTDIRSGTRMCVELPAQRVPGSGSRPRALSWPPI